MSSVVTSSDKTRGGKGGRACWRGFPSSPEPTTPTSAGQPRELPALLTCASLAPPRPMPDGVALVQYKTFASELREHSCRLTDPPGLQTEGRKPALLRLFPSLGEASLVSGTAFPVGQRLDRPNAQFLRVFHRRFQPPPPQTPLRADVCQDNSSCSQLQIRARGRVALILANPWRPPLLRSQ